MKVVEEELLDRCIEGSGIFLIWADRPIKMNYVMEGLRQRRLDDIHWEIWLATESSCEIEVEKEAGEKGMISFKQTSHKLTYFGYTRHRVATSVLVEHFFAYAY